MDKLERVKLELREAVLPYFSDEEITFFVEKYGEDRAIYEMLIIKSENTSVSLSGLSLSDTREYFLRLASKWRRFNTGNLGE